MPMAAPELAAKFEDDGVAWDVLKAHGWEMAHHFLIPPAMNSFPMKEGKEADALDYLCDEYDYDIMSDEVRQIIISGP